jgi:hypothetical protein
MIEGVFFILGAGFSVLVYYLSIRPANVSPGRKAVYFLLSLVGIAGMIFLFGIMASFVINGMK